MTATTTTVTQDNITYFCENFSKDGLNHLMHDMLNKLYILEKQNEFYTNQAKTFTIMAETTGHTIEGLKEELNTIREVLKIKKAQSV